MRAIKIPETGISSSSRNTCFVSMGNREGWEKSQHKL